MREEFELELENRIKNLIWTVSGDYTLDVKPDIESYHRSHAVGLYDGIKQGAFARYFNREELSLYLMNLSAWGRRTSYEPCTALY